MATLRLLTSADLHELLVEGQDIQVLDVRTPAEFAAGHIAGAVLVPHDEIAGWPEALDPERPTAVICKAGVRALHAAAILDQLTGPSCSSWPRAACRTGRTRRPAHHRIVRRAQARATPALRTPGARRGTDSGD